MTLKITEKCARCALCVAKCPQRAIVYDREAKEEGMTRYPLKIDASKCTNCELCISVKNWCPIQAIVKL